MARPIFVIGNNRSGTHWLSNILLNHPDVSGIQHEYHDGIVETEILLAMPRIFGPLANLGSRICFIECFAATDYFRVSGVTKNDLYSFPVHNYHDFLRAFQDRVAHNRGKSFWLQKFSPAVLPDIIRHFPDARFVMIQRDVVPTVRSSIKKWGRCSRGLEILKYVYWYYYGTCKMRVHWRHPSVLILRYEQLKAETEPTIREVCRFMGLDYRPEMIHVPYRPNTSFPQDSSSDYLTRAQHNWIRILSGFFRWWPLAGFSAVRWLHRMFTNPIPRLYSVSFHLLQEERGLVSSNRDSDPQTPLDDPSPGTN
jgi:hypothetical protein